MYYHHEDLVLPEELRLLPQEVIGPVIPEFEASRRAWSAMFPRRKKSPFPLCSALSSESEFRISDRINKKAPDFELENGYVIGYRTAFSFVRKLDHPQRYMSGVVYRSRYLDANHDRQCTNGLYLCASLDKLSKNNQFMCLWGPPPMIVIRCRSMRVASHTVYGKTRFRWFQVIGPL